MRVLVVTLESINNMYICPEISRSGQYNSSQRQVACSSHATYILLGACCNSCVKICRSGKYKKSLIGDIIIVNAYAKNNFTYHSSHKSLLFGHIFKYHDTGCGWSVWNIISFCFYLFVIFQFGDIFYIWYESGSFPYLCYCYYKKTIFSVKS